MFSRYGCSSWDFSKLRNQMRSISLNLCTWGIEVPLCDTWMLKIFSNHYSKTRLWALIVYGHEACNLYEVLYMSHINYYYRWHNCISQNYIFSISLLYSKMKSSSTWVILLPSAKGLSFTFILSLHLLCLCTN